MKWYNSNMFSKKFMKKLYFKKENANLNSCSHQWFMGQYKLFLKIYVRAFVVYYRWNVILRWGHLHICQICPQGPYQFANNEKFVQLFTIMKTINLLAVTHPPLQNMWCAYRRFSILLNKIYIFILKKVIILLQRLNLTMLTEIYLLEIHFAWKFVFKLKLRSTSKCILYLQAFFVY